jgi:YD repeat-containing protein
MMSGKTARLTRVNGRWAILLTALAVIAAVVIVVRGSVSSAAPGSPLDVAMMSDDSGAPQGPQWPEGDFADSQAIAAAPKAAKAAGVPVAPVLAAPDGGATVATTRPELRANPVNGKVQYRFVIGTGDSPAAGQVATSGWIAKPSWVVPAGVLSDGTPYSWTAQVRDTASGTAGPEAEARALVVNLRLGPQQPGGPIATDTIGPLSVNLATGNVTTTLMSQFMFTGYGPLLVQFTYNSLAAAQSGLVGSYFPGDSPAGIADNEHPVSVRTDAQVSFLWGIKGSVPPGVDGDKFRVRWQGYVRVPETGSYDFGGLYRSGLRVWVGDQQAYDNWNNGRESGAAAYGGGIRLEAGKAYPIRVDYRATGFPSFVQLWARVNGGRSAPIPASWLSPSASVLPPGWTMSPGPEGFVAATTTEAGVTLTDSKGSSAAFTRKADGGYQAATGGGSLSRDKSGTFTATSAGGVKSVFAANGTLQSMRGGSHGSGAPAGNAPAGGGQHEAAPAAAVAATKMQWAQGDAKQPDARPTSLSTLDGGMTIQFYYSGDAKCADKTAPAGYLCAVALPDGATSYLSYSHGQLVRLRNPGNDITDLAFNQSNQLTKLRPSLVMDWIGVDARRRDTAAAAYLVGYQSDTGRATKLEGPEPTGTEQRPAQRPSHEYAYTADSTEVRTAGLQPKQGWTQRITRDVGGRTLTDTDATGRTAEYQWTPDDQQVSKVDQAGRRTTVVPGPAGISTYGPAAKNCFTPQGSPVAPAPAGCDRMPEQRMAMDGATMTTTTVESDGVPDKQVGMSMNEFGIPVRNVLDPGGLALATETKYDDFFRPLSLSLPTGSTTTWDYYGPGETAKAPCDPNAPAADQLGQVKVNYSPKPAQGAAREDKYVYNDRSQLVGMNFGTSHWVCGSYDERGRTKSILIQGDDKHPDRNTTFDFAAGGDPLTAKATDTAGTVTLISDLLGRYVGYVDIYGVRTNTTFDRAGRLVAQTATPATGGDQARTITRKYDDAGRLLEVRHADRTLATVKYTPGGEVAGVTYANGTSLADVVRDTAGRVTTLTWKLSDNKQVSSTVKRTKAGTIVDESLAGVDARPGGPNYVYDAAGRLVQAYTTGHHFTYDFTSQSSKSCPAGTEPNAGRNNNAVRVLDETRSGTATTEYCYDNADRLLGASGAKQVSDVKFSSPGHVSQFTVDGQQVGIVYDVAERYTDVSIAGADPASVNYGYDIFDSVVSRTVSGSKHDDGKVLYSVNVMTATEVFTMNPDRKVLTRTVPLPGGISVAIGADGQETWNLANVQGDVALVADGRGRQVGDPYTYTPFGAPLTTDGKVDSDRVPANQPSGNGYAWRGEYLRRYEHAGGLSLVVFGLRQLDTGMGRFHAMSTVDNTLTAINYQYIHGDPINSVSLNGYNPQPNVPDLTGMTGPIGQSP